MKVDWKIIVALIALASCASHAGAPAQADNETSAQTQSFIWTPEESQDRRKWYISDFTMSQDFMQAAWEADNVTFGDEAVRLKLTHAGRDGKPYTGAELQRRGFFSHGRFEVVMRAAPGSGTATGFFTHTNSYFGDPHDEIDIEVVGKDTSILLAGYFVNGRKGPSRDVKLPYDAAETFQLYAFDWAPGGIRWYVGDQLVHEVTATDAPIPVAAGRLISHLWTGGKAQYDWHGRPDFEDGATMAIRCMSYREAGDIAGAQCSDRFSFDLPPVVLD